MPSPKKQSTLQKLSKTLSQIPRSTKFLIAGIGLVVLGFATLAGTYLPMAWATLRYHLTPQQNVTVVADRPEQLDTQKQFLFAKSPDFGVVIPKIHANTRIIANVNPFKSEVYQQELSKGVAHAAGTALPDQDGTVFLFAHSAGDISKARQYNAVFYLIDKLQTGDEIYVFYKRQKYKYVVTKQEVVNPDQVEFLTSKDPQRKIILMTCTPAGTTRQRLLVHAELVPTE